MKKESILYTKSLKEQVYEYLREEIHKQNLLPGAIINMDATSKKLGISKTPLRDALLQMEMEGFVTIAPRRGIYVNTLAIEDIKQIYQVIGALEHSALTCAFSKIKTTHVKKMERLVTDMKKALAGDNFDLFYKKNLEFHDIYINLNQNDSLFKIVNNLKKRLYDFLPQERWIKEWEEASTLEHEKMIRLIKEGKARQAADFVRDVHWSFSVQEKFIRRYYANNK
ncbi:MAG: GntR family transcriptional regulator [bacterium]|nr:GntR family transcriptional regulator [bacterium]